MSFKKFLGVISIVIIVMFTLMLTTSYAWYSFEGGSTTFDTITDNDDIEISFQKGEYIATTTAVPVNQLQVDKYAEKNSFNIKVKDDVKDELLVSISLIDIVIDSALKDSNFKIDLYYQDNNVASFDGTNVNDTVLKLKDITLGNYVDNEFELRIYILDNGLNQVNMMNKTFSAKIKVDVVAREKISMEDYKDADVKITSIAIDGKDSDYLPVDGYYEMTSTCVMGSVLSWEPFTKTIIYGSGAKTGDNCSLSFTSATSDKLLNTVKVGSYVKYEGNNGCDGNACLGENANYKSDSNMGYCGNKNSRFITNGWRVAYVKDSTAYLVSAGSPECGCTSSNGNYSNNKCDSYSKSFNVSNLDKSSLKYCNKNYAYGGVCNNSSAWAMDSEDFKNILGNDLNANSCYSVGSTMICGYNNDLIDIGSYYWYATGFEESLEYAFYWNPYNRDIERYTSDYVYGVRPVIRMAASVKVVSGSGTYVDPYVIAN